MGDIYEDVEDAHPLGVDGANEPSSNAKWGDPEFRVVYLQEDQLGGGFANAWKSIREDSQPKLGI